MTARTTEAAQAASPAPGQAAASAASATSPAVGHAAARTSMRR
jgi:hypothetical protein